MTAVQREYLLKGVFLGVWAFFALSQPTAAGLGQAVGLTAAGLAVGLVAGAVRLLAVGYRPAANPGGFLLLTLLDNPLLVYLGVVGGATAGVLLGTAPPRDWLLYCAGGGAVLGLGLYQLSRVRGSAWRLVLGGVVGAGLTYLALHYLGQLPAFQTVAGERAFAVALLCGLPAFYLLVFCGDADESEVEIAALCATLAVGMYMTRQTSRIPEQFDKLILLGPLLLYFVYVTRYQPRLRVFKHVLRGFGNLSVGRTRDALVGFGRALQLDPRSELAANGLRRLHRSLDPATLDPQTVPLLNFGFMLDRAEGLLVRDRPPTAAERAEAEKMLDLADAHRPALSPRTDHLRAIAQTHAGEFDAAAATLSRLFDPATPYPDGRWREAVLLPAWDLATRVHPELVKRLGAAELAKPGRRLDAIAAVERRLVASPDDPVAVGLKRELYAGLTEAEFAAGAVPAGFNFDHVEQLGLSLVEDADPARVERGMAYLRMAGRGLPARGPVLFRTLAGLATRLGRADEAAGYLGQVKRAGLAVGVAALAPDQKAAYVAAVKELADAAETRGDFAAAVDDYRLYVEAAGEDVAKLKHLADLYSKAGDPRSTLNALAITERGLLYAKADPELLAKKDSFYYSVEPAAIREVRDKVTPWFDVAYCVRKATAVAGQAEADLDTLDYGLHLVRLARVMQPESNAVRYAEGRLLLRRGEKDAGLALLEDVRESKRGSGDEEDAWFLATRLLGDLYLDDLNRPDLAVGCFKDFRDFQKSGADTLYRLGQAHEAAGDTRAAVQSYKAVTAYSGHPRYWDADAAVKRLSSPAT